MCRWAATVLPLPPEPIASPLWHPDLLCEHCLNCPCQLPPALPSPGPASLPPPAPRKRVGGSAPVQASGFGGLARSRGDTPLAALCSSPSRAAVGSSPKAQRCWHPGFRTIPGQSAFFPYSASGSLSVLPILGSFPSSLPHPCLAPITLVLEPLPCSGSLLAIPKTVILGPVPVQVSGSRVGQRSELEAKFSPLQGLSRDPAPGSCVHPDPQRLAIGLRALHLGLETLKALVLRPRPKSWGNSREKERKELEQEPRTSLRAEAHRGLLHGEGGLGLA